jgi:hypothetical protein
MQPDEGPHGRNQANVTALGDLNVRGGDIKGKYVNLIALGDVTLRAANVDAANKAKIAGTGITLLIQ